LSQGREQRVVKVDLAISTELGRWLWCLDDARRRTLQRLAGLDPRLVDWVAPESGNSVGCILYHLAAMELDYLYSDVLGQRMPPDIMQRFPYEIREENGHLTPIRGFELAWYLERLDFAHQRVQELFRAMDIDEFRRVRQLSDRPVDITPEWTLYHLTQHEAEHRGELASIRGRAEAAERSAR
jgi:uncharacterized damage-inducible protein DinB